MPGWVSSRRVSGYFRATTRPPWHKPISASSSRSLRMDVGVFSASGGNGGSAESARHTKVAHERAAANLMCRGRYQDVDDHREALTRATTALKSKLCGVSNDQWYFAPSLNAQHNGHEALNKRKRSAAADEVVEKEVAEEVGDAEEQQREQQQHEQRQVCIPQPHLHYVSPVQHLHWLCIPYPLTMYLD